MKSNPYADIDGDFWQPPSDSARKWFAAQQQARPATPEPPPVSPVTRDRLAALDARDGFLHPPGQFPVSPTLAAQLHYHPPAVSSFAASNEGEKSDVPLDGGEAELRSIEEMQRR